MVWEDGGGNPASYPMAPGMGTDLEVQVLPEPDHRNRREAQGRKGDRPSGGSVERTRELTNRNRIQGAADQGERARNREALMVKGKRRKSGSCARKVRVLIRGDLASRLKGRRSIELRSEKSAEVVVAA